MAKITSSIAQVYTPLHLKYGRPWRLDEFMEHYCELPTFAQREEFRQYMLSETVPFHLDADRVGTIRAIAKERWRRTISDVAALERMRDEILADRSGHLIVPARNKPKATGNPLFENIPEYPKYDEIWNYFAKLEPYERTGKFPLLRFRGAVDVKALALTFLSDTPTFAAKINATLAQWFYTEQTGRQATPKTFDTKGQTSIEVDRILNRAGSRVTSG